MKLTLVLFEAHIKLNRQYMYMYGTMKLINHLSFKASVGYVVTGIIKHSYNMQYMEMTLLNHNAVLKLIH